MKIIKSEVKIGSGEANVKSTTVSEKTIQIQHSMMSIKHEHILETYDAIKDYEESYEYELYSFSIQTNLVAVRSYTSEPNEAHFLRIEVDGKARPLKVSDFQTPLLKGAVEYLAKSGKARMNWLDPSNTYNGYSKVPNTKQ